MRIPITKEMSLMELKEKLEAEFPGIIVKWRGPKVLIVHEQGSSAAAQVMLLKKKVIVNEGFATMGGQMLFMFTMLIFGIVIPFLIYMLTFKPKQTAVIEKIAPVIRDKWGQSSF